MVVQLGKRIYSTPSLFRGSLFKSLQKTFLPFYLPANSALGPYPVILSDLRGRAFFRF